MHTSILFLGIYCFDFSFKYDARSFWIRFVWPDLESRQLESWNQIIIQDILSCLYWSLLWIITIFWYLNLICNNAYTTPDIQKMVTMLLLLMQCKENLTLRLKRIMSQWEIWGDYCNALSKDNCLILLSLKYSIFHLYSPGIVKSRLSR